MLTKIDLGKNTFSLAMDNSIGFAASGVKTYRKEKDGVTSLIVEDMPVFRSGSFRNSWGELTTWSQLHIHQMVSNFEFLRSNSIFADVPVRASHPEPWFRNSTNEVIGYVSSLRAETRSHPGNGKEFTYLLANYEITDPAAMEKVENKTYRNRSAEVGMYVDNDEAEYYPVLVGFAYVDIPAVEGLNFGKRAEIRRYAVDEERVQMTEEESSEAVETPEEVTEEIEEIPEEVSEETSEEIVDEVEETEPELVQTTSQPLIVSDGNFTSSTAYGVTSNFSINFGGQVINDPAVIQGIVNSLHGAVAEDRNNYVRSMFKNKRITSAQLEPLKEFASGLTIEQWSQFRSIFDDSPEVQVLSFRSGETPDDGETSEKDSIQSEIINHLSNALGTDRVKETGIWQRVTGEKEGSK